MSWVPRSLFAPGLSYNQKVIILYRRAVRTAFDWSDNRQVYYKLWKQIKDEFRSTKHIRDPFILNRLLTNGERQVLEKAHPAPYIHPESPGGSRWERNIPPPAYTTKESCFVEF